MHDVLLHGYNDAEENRATMLFDRYGEIKYIKENAKKETGAEEYVSTNDIITSGFGRATKAQMLTMPINIRGKEEKCNKNLAGNYWTGLMFGADALSSPNGIRNSLNGQAPYSRCVLPGCCIKGNWSSMITNWSSMSNGSLDIPDCTQILHVPYLNTKEMLEDSCVIFKARPNEIAVMLFLHSVTLDEIKQELPLGKKCQKNVLIIILVANCVRYSGSFPLVRVLARKSLVSRVVYTSSGIYI